MRKEPPLINANNIRFVSNCAAEVDTYNDSDAHLRYGKKYFIVGKCDLDVINQTTKQIQF